MKVVLMYHDIVTESDKSSGFQNSSAFQYKTNAHSFEEQVKALSPKKVTFSFDDGGISFLKTAAPILEKYGHRGLFFIATDYIGTPGFLDIPQIRELEDRGHIIGSHSCSHPENMTLLSEEDIAMEWIGSINILENILGHKVEYASIPNGFSSRDVISKAHSAGIRHLYTSSPTDEITHYDSMQIYGRYVIHNKMSTSCVQAIIESKFVRQRIHIKYILLEGLKKVLGRQYKNIKDKLLNAR